MAKQTAGNSDSGNEDDRRFVRCASAFARAKDPRHKWTLDYKRTYCFDAQRSSSYTNKCIQMAKCKQALQDWTTKKRTVNMSQRTGEKEQSNKAIKLSLFCILITAIVLPFLSLY